MAKVEVQEGRVNEEAGDHDLMTDSIQESKPCLSCRELTPVVELDFDGNCTVCNALMSLRATLIEKGRIKPDLFDQARGHHSLPPSDRE